MVNVHNFRDLGGVEAEERRIMKKGLLYRSAHLDRINEKDLQQLLSLGIKTVIDLREDWEIKVNKKLANNFHIIHLPINYDRITKKKLEVFLYKKKAKTVMKEIVKEAYIEFITSQKETIKKVFTIISNIKNYSILIHCRAGKDRTGIIIALILLALGVDYHKILKDYLLSNRMYLPRMQRFLKIIKLITFGVIKTENIAFLLTTYESYLKAIYDTINEKYGGIHQYLQFCGINNTDLNLLNNILLTDADDIDQQ